MIVYLNKTTYQEFDAWLYNKAGKYGFRVSYDEMGLIDKLSDIDNLPKEIYPLRIYLSKIFANGLSIDQSGFFLVEKVGERLKICPRGYKGRGGELVPILREIADDWQESRERILKEIDKADSMFQDIKPSEPWEKITDYYYDRQLVKLWWDKNIYLCSEIGQKLSLTSTRVTNRLSELRKIYGTEIVPFNSERRTKSRDNL